MKSYETAEEITDFSETPQEKNHCVYIITANVLTTVLESVPHRKQFYVNRRSEPLFSVFLCFTLRPQSHIDFFHFHSFH